MKVTSYSSTYHQANVYEGIMDRKRLTDDPLFKKHFNSLEEIQEHIRIKGNTRIDFSTNLMEIIKATKKIGLITIKIKEAVQRDLNKCSIEKVLEACSSG